MRVFLLFPVLILIASLAWGADKFEVKFLAAPKAMTPFNVEIKALTAPVPQKIKISFEMKAMYMGDFKFEAEAKDGVYLLQKVTLPRCMSGDKTWVLVIDYGGGKQEVNFELND
ncbi:MAG: hypothetical protein LBD73_04485 [Deferribacteraceae bacterium]|jgi:hypothetical protein|nr:hypothetical protein [Deferribacteraceae bacterium]